MNSSGVDSGGAGDARVTPEFGAHCGFRTDHAVNLYTSPDLENWTFVADVFPLEARPEGIYFRNEFLTIPDILFVTKIVLVIEKNF